MKRAQAIRTVPHDPLYCEFCQQQTYRPWRDPRVHAAAAVLFVAACLVAAQLWGQKP